MQPASLSRRGCRERVAGFGGGDALQLLAYVRQTEREEGRGGEGRGGAEERGGGVGVEGGGRKREALLQ